MDDAQRRELKVQLAEATANGDRAEVKRLQAQLDGGYETAQAQPAVETTDVTASEPAAVETEAGIYDDFTKDELVAELERRSLTKTGNKDELIERLEEDDLV